MKNIEAAREYARRARKGLPVDRFADGADGERAVARGIDEMDYYLAMAVQRIEMLEEANKALQAEKYKSGLEAMEPSLDPMRKP